MTKKIQSEWELNDAYEFVLRLLLCLQMNAPLNLNLRHMFASIMGKFMFHMNCDAGIHIFFNYNDALKACNIDHLHLDKNKKDGKYLQESLVERNQRGKILSKPPPYIGDKVRKIEAYGWFKLLQEWQNGRMISIRKGEELNEIISAFNKRRDTCNLTGSKVDLISCLSDDIIVIPFNLTSHNFGLFILWSSSQSN